MHLFGLTPWGRMFRLFLLPCHPCSSRTEVENVLTCLPTNWEGEAVRGDRDSSRHSLQLCLAWFSSGYRKPQQIKMQSAQQSKMRVDPRRELTAKNHLLLPKYLDKEFQNEPTWKASSEPLAGRSARNGQMGQYLCQVS